MISILTAGATIQEMNFPKTARMKTQEILEIVGVATQEMNFHQTASMKI